MSEVLKSGMNIGFKCGLQSALANYISGTSVADDGVFYLTTDTHRLYVGSNGKAVPVNQGILTVATQSDLAGVAGEAGQFYYIADTNVLAVRSGNQWIQINPDTGIDSMSSELSAITDGAKVTVKVTDSNNQSVSTSFNITAKQTDGATVEVDADTNTVKVKGDPVTLGVAADAGKAKIGLSSARNSASGEVKVSIETQNAGTSSIAVENGEIKIKEVDTRNDSLTITSDATGFTVGVADTQGDVKSGSVDPKIKLGASGTEVSFVNGVATLDTYSKGEIGSLLQGLNAMTYKGTVGDAGTAGTGITKGANEVITGIAGVDSYSIGDTFLLIQDYTFKTAATDASATRHEKGSLLIARGTEDTNGVITSGLVFDVVEESNDTDTTYKFIEATEAAGGNYDAGFGVQIQDSQDTPVGSFVIQGKNVANSASVGVEKVKSVDENGGVREVIAVVHDTVSQNNTTDPAVTFNDNTRTTSVVSGVVVDSTGHITGVKTKEITVDPTEITDFGASTAVAGNAGTVTHNITLSDGSGNPVSQVSANFSVESDSLTITNKADNSGLKMEMLWGSF